MTRGRHAAPQASARQLEAARADRAELRRLIRELHQAAAGARAAAAELRQAQEDLAFATYRALAARKWP